MKARFFARTAGALAALAFCATGLANAPTLTPTLKIGDPAPTVDAMAWIKGKPVGKFEPGHVYVVEFWATWCGPCNRFMPHLSALQKKYSGRLTVIGVNAREAEAGKAQVDAVRKFVDKKGDRMAYTVAMDDPVGKTVFDAWMTAAGSYGIPTSFVVDRQGRMVWVGHPQGKDKTFETAVEQALNGTSDLAAARALQEKVNRETAERLQNI